MNGKQAIIIGSLAVNVALLGALALNRNKGPLPAQDNATSQAAAPNSPSFPQRPKPIVAGTAAPTGPGFHWSQVESPDFRAYIANLRSIGCPEETIRDLVVAEVNKAFAPRFASLAQVTSKYDYWRSGGKKEAREELSKQLAALVQEKKALLHELLGIDHDPSEKWANVTLDKLAEEGRYAFIAPEKQQQVRDIIDKYDKLQSPTDGARLSTQERRRLREERRQELAQLLTGEELRQLDLRVSTAADALRGRFGSADLTEDEYQRLFALRKAYEDEQGVIPDTTTPEVMNRRREARKQLEDAYKSALGEARVAEIEKQQDPAWRGLTRLSQQYNLPAQTVNQVYEYQRAANEQIGRLLSDQTIAQDARQNALRQIASETETALKGILGEDMYGKFKQNAPEFRIATDGGDTISLLGAGPPRGGIIAAPGQRITTTYQEGGAIETKSTVVTK